VFPEATPSLRLALRELATVAAKKVPGVFEHGAHVWVPVFPNVIHRLTELCHAA
jgi:hypothetical protein